MFDLAEAIGRSPFELAEDKPGAKPHGEGRGWQAIIDPSVDYPELVPVDGLRLFGGGVGRIISWSGSTEAAMNASSSQAASFHAASSLLPDALIMESPHMVQLCLSLSGLTKWVRPRSFS
jgi:hypothetical protein